MPVMLSKTEIFIRENLILTDGVIRVFFKIYFIITMLFMALVGSWACKMQVRNRLLNGHAVTLTATTGWIQGPSLAKAIFQLRRLPGGWLGWLMLLGSALNLAGSLGVAKSVTSVTRASTRSSETGLIVDQDQEISTNPDIRFGAYSWAATAQLFSQMNADNSSGVGIYRFFYLDYDFRATDEDIIGNWTCSKTTEEPVMYDQQIKGNSEEIYDEQIFDDLVKRGLIYDYYDGSGQARMVNYSSYLNGSAFGPSKHLTIFTASDYIVGNIFEIKAAVDVLDLDQRGSKMMDTFHCQLHPMGATKIVEEIAKELDIVQIFGEWIATITGTLYPFLNASESLSAEEIESNLVIAFNSMIMVAGSGQSTNSTNYRGYHYSIVEHGTSIPHYVIGICVLLAAINVFLLAFSLWLRLAMYAQCRSYDQLDATCAQVSSKEIMENTPVGLLDWMRYAATESRDTEQTPARSQLGSWRISTTWHKGRRLGVVSSHEYREFNPLHTQGAATYAPQEEFLLTKR